jgi:hypothetical protein
MFNEHKTMRKNMVRMEQTHEKGRKINAEEE